MATSQYIYENRKKGILSAGSIETISSTQTYQDRLAMYWKYVVFNPRTLFVSKVQLTDHLALIHDYKEKCSRSSSPICVSVGELSAIDNAVATRMAVLRPAVLSSTTPKTDAQLVQEGWIPPPFRFTAFPFVNTFTVFTLLTTPRLLPIPASLLSTTPHHLAFPPHLLGALRVVNGFTARRIGWNWCNQSVNVLQDYYYRASDKDDGRLLQGYVCGTLASTLAWLSFDKLQFIKSSSNVMLKEVLPPTLGCMVAHTLGLLIVRRKEYQEGILVTDEHKHEVIGISQCAGAIAVGSSFINRTVALVPGMFVPTLLMSRLQSTGLFSRYPKVRIPIHIACCTATLVGLLPFVLAIFPDRIIVPGSYLGSKFSTYEQVSFCLGK